MGCLPPDPNTAAASGLRDTVGWGRGGRSRYRFRRNVHALCAAERLEAGDEGVVTPRQGHAVHPGPLQGVLRGEPDASRHQAGGVPAGANKSEGVGGWAAG